ncbi:MAG: hypothetical protein ACK5P5_03115 [Pseudobdellovibrionaceae bacterium]
MWCLCYFLSAFVKFTDGWIAGTYFSSLQMGMPLVHNNLIPAFTHFVILAEIFMGFALLSAKWRKISFLLWILFHLYSTILVGFFYPVRCLVMLTALFYADLHTNKDIIPRINFKTILFFILIVAMQTMPVFFQENPQMTLRTEGYGFSMIDANYQCSMTIKNVDLNHQLIYQKKSKSARGRCGAKRAWDTIQHQCSKHPKSNLFVELDLSLNGEPFRKVIQGDKACEWSFPFWGTIPWFNENGPVVGYPNYNGIDDDSRRQLIHSKKMIQETALQEWIKENLRPIKIFYLILWCAVLSVFLLALISRNRNAKFK